MSGCKAANGKDIKTGQLIGTAQQLSAGVSSYNSRAEGFFFDRIYPPNVTSERVDSDVSERQQYQQDGRRPI